MAGVEGFDDLRVQLRADLARVLVVEPVRLLVGISFRIVVLRRSHRRRALAPASGGCEGWGDLEVTLSRTRRWILAAAVALAASPAAASAAPALNGEFDVSGEPQHLATGPDGNVWFTISASTATVPTQLGRIKPDGTVDEFPLKDNPTAGGIVTGPDNRLWITVTNHVLRVDPANPAVAQQQEFPVDIVNAQTIVVGPDGNLWTASADKVIKIAPSNGAVLNQYPVTAPGGGDPMNARGIAAAGGQIWVVDFHNSQIVKMTTAGVFSDATKFALGNGAGPQEIAPGPDGQLGFGAPNASPPFFGRMNYDGSFQQTNGTPGTDPSGIVFGNDGAYWVGQFGANSVGRYTPDGVHTDIPLGDGTGPRHVAKGAGDTIWVGLQTAKKIARITGVSRPPDVQPQPQPEPPLDRLAPGVTEYVFGSKVMRTFAGRGASLARVKRGARVTYTVTEAGTATFTVQRARPGRKVKAGKPKRTRCVKPTRGNTRRKKCTRFTRVGSFTRQSVAGRNRFTFTGRVKNRPLRPGRYRMLLVARDAAGNASKPAAVRFRVVR